MRRVVTTSLLVLALAGVARAQQQSTQAAAASASAYIDPINGLTLDDAISRAVAEEPSLRASRAQVDAARGLLEQAGLRPNPAVSFSQQEEPSGSDNQTRIELQWPLDLFRKPGRVGVADREVEVARHATADRERMLVADVRRKYGEAAVAARTLTTTEELLAAVSRQQVLVAARVDQGAAPPLDRDMLRVEVQRLQADRLIQAGAVEQRLTELRRLLGIPPDAPLALRDSLEALVRRDPAAAADNMAGATHRPDIQQAEAQLRLGDAAVDRARREGRPDLSVVGMYMRMDAGFPQLGLSPAGAIEPIRSVFHYVSIGAMVTLPFQNRNQGAVAAAQADRAGAAAQLEAVRLSAQSEIAAARSRDAHARQALQIYAADTVALARHNLDVVRQTYELGRGTLVDVLSEQRRYLDVERAYTDVLRESYEAREALKTALGELR